MSSWLTRAWQWLGLAPIQIRSESTLPSRVTSPLALDVRQASAMPDVFRALQVLTTATGQLSIDEEGPDGRRLETPSSLVRRPSIDMTRSEWINELVLSMAGWGDAYLYLRRAEQRGPVLSLDPWHPSEVHVELDRDGRRWYHRRGVRYSSADVRQMSLMRLPGAANGISPIEAARTGLSTAAAMTQYVAEWWNNGPNTQTLTTEQELTGAQMKAVQRIYNGRDPITGEKLDQSDNPERIRILHKGAKVERTILKPADLMWLEAQNYSTQQVARLWGMPTSLMLIAIEGGSRSYSNIEQEWIGLTRFTVMGYLRPIEDVLTDVLPRTTARFSLDALLRSDTISRYRAHQIAIAAGFMTPAYAAAIEGLPTPPAPTKPALAPSQEQNA